VFEDQLYGRVAIVTGGGQGLGLAVARALRDRGASGLVVVGRDGDKLGRAVAELSTGTCRAEPAAVDLGDPDAPAAVAALADGAFGRVDVLVNAAAITERGSVWDADAAMWDRMLAVNVRAPALLISAVARIMVREGLAGSIVNIGSVAAHGGQDYLFPYATSKGALVPLTRNAAHTLMRHRIRVNLLQPGWMATQGEDIIQRRYHGAGDGWLEEVSARMPFGRLIEPEELARAVCFLASDQSGMLTGAVIDYDQSVLGAGETSRPSLEPAWGEG
jgi:NAD(P)-dependent dehydrogenase (short-subunit alcohol dehydrogenase family)